MARTRRSVRNHHGKPHEHAPGDPLGVYLPPLAKWQHTKPRKEFSYTPDGRYLWNHPALPWQFRISYHDHDYSERYRSARPASYGVVFSTDGRRLAQFYAVEPQDVYAQMKQWYASQTPKSAWRLSTQNPDWSAMRAKAAHYGSRAATGAREAYEWTAPRAKRAAAATWEGAKTAGRAAKRGAKRAAPVVARGARSAAESMERWAQTNGRCAMRNGASLTKAQTDALVEAYAKYLHAGRGNENIKIQQKLYNRYSALLDKALDKFGVRVAPESFMEDLRHRADAWIGSRAFRGPGTFY